MDIAIPKRLADKATEWDELHRWERSELGKALRRLGLTYGEIRSIIPVPKGTLSDWCREIDLSDEQIAAIKARTGSQKGVPRNTQWRRRLEIETIRAEARSYARRRLRDPFFVAGVVLYWGEGSKTRNDLSLANADPHALRLFISWVRTYHDESARFVLKINLHSDNDEIRARDYWSTELRMENPDFHRTYVKPDGTGHRKNHLAHGVCQVRVRASSDAWHRTMEWIDVVAQAWLFVGALH